MIALIIEDDPMVQFIHRNYLEKTEFFDTILSTDTIKEAYDLLKKHEVDLILLDIHLKDGNGLDFLADFRQLRTNSDVIMITAADDMRAVTDGLHLGALDYLIKPFTFVRFNKSIQLFKDKHTCFNGQERASQDLIDTMKLQSLSSEKETTEQNIEKGLSHHTLEHLLSIMNQLTQPFTVQDVSRASDLSHVSIRKYLAYLEQEKRLHSDTIYTKIGRPYKVFTLTKTL